MKDGIQSLAGKETRRPMKRNRSDDSVPLRDPASDTNPVGLPWPKVTREEWNDYQWQLSHRITSIGDLSGLRYFPREEAELLTRVTEAYHLSITPYYLSLIRLDDPDDPIARQAIPSPEEYYGREVGEDDPLEEEKDMPVPGLTHRYPDRCLMVVTNFCSMYCRHCTRKRIWPFGEAAKTEFELNKMFGYIRRHEEIRDVIVSGGDPLTLPTPRIEFILRGLRRIPHVEIIRIGTRVPVVLPMRIDDELCAVLEKYGPIWVNTQFNHPREITPEAEKACDRLLRTGIPVNNQSVLLKGINDHPEVIRTLNMRLVQAKVRPYYLFQCDMVRGLEHFRTRLSKGIEIMEALRGHTSGLAIPSYVVDVPGGGGKIPLMPNYLLSMGEQRTILRNYEGIIVSYEEPRDDGRSSARPETELPASRPDVYRLMTGEVKALIPAGNDRMAKRRRRCESGSPTT
jgi:lysine 2,3-aminomutase